MVRMALAGLMAAHGFAHLVGFLVPWKFLEAQEMPYSTTLLAGRLDVGDAGIRVVGLMWLGLAGAFFMAAGVTWLDRASWPEVAMSASAISLVLCILGLPAARIGVPVNLVLLAALLGGRWAGWW